MGRQFARTPVDISLRLRWRRQAHDLRCIDTRLAPAARQVRLNRSDAVFGKSISPGDNLTPIDLKSPCNLMIANPVGYKQYNSSTSNATGIKRLRSHAAFQFQSLFIRQRDRGGLLHHSLRKKGTNMASTIISSSNYSKALH